MSEEEKIIKGILENEYSNEVEKVESADSEVNKEEVVVSTKENTEKNNKKNKNKKIITIILIILVLFIYYSVFSMINREKETEKENQQTYKKDTLSDKEIEEKIKTF